MLSSTKRSESKFQRIHSSIYSMDNKEVDSWTELCSFGANFSEHIIFARKPRKKKFVCVLKLDHRLKSYDHPDFGPTLSSCKNLITHKKYEKIPEQVHGFESGEKQLIFASFLRGQLNVYAYRGKWNH